MGTPTRQILGPLTTPWSQPAGCSVIVRKDSSYTDELWQGQSCQMTGSSSQSNYWVHQAQECFPPRTAGVTTPANSIFDHWGFYSPGIACPVSWTRACTVTYGEVGGAMPLAAPMTLQAGETAAGCCPESYTCLSDYPKCRRVLTTPFGAIVCDTSAVGEQIPVPSPYLNKDGAGTAVASFTVGMPMVQVVWKETDLPTTKASQPPSNSAIGTDTTAKSTDTAVATTAAAGGLSEGTLVGLAVGASLGAVIVFMSIAFFIFVWRQRRKKATNTNEAARQPSDIGTPQQQYWIQQNGELPADSSTGELSDGNRGPFITAELPGHFERLRPTKKYRKQSFINRA
ncbi:CRA-b-like protein [Apiospora arundinis]|uniref:CRA-b-like protein n=1 Tax=Apiospora arundinis TaxID=335852 RepID=A0ABR2HRA9_9PEZI